MKRQKIKMGAKHDNFAFQLVQHLERDTKPHPRIHLPRHSFNDVGLVTHLVDKPMNHKVSVVLADYVVF